MTKIKGLRKAISEVRKLNKCPYGQFYGILYFDFETNTAYTRELMRGNFIKFAEGSKKVDLPMLVKRYGFDELNTETAKLAIDQFYNDPANADFF